ncbi:kinase [Gammaproteobacteria bacterium 45_16_T64]|nr:kinase [Gammaproteobacteria bacterium 45_16_T64]
MDGVIFVGLQASGKTSFYLNEFYRTHIRLSMDMLRTRHRESLLIDACLASKQPCVIDNTNPTIANRESYIRKFRANRFDVVGYYFQSSLNECLERNSKRDGKCRIPDVGVRGTYNKLELPKYAEGFDRLYYVAMKESRFIIKEWIDEV